MRTLMLKATLMAALAVPLAAAATQPAADVGPRMQTHAMTDLDGRNVRLDQFAGEVLVVNFWASWCAPCRHELPVLDAWNTAWRDAGARVVAVSIDTKVANAREFVARDKLDLTVWIDGPDGLAAELDLPAVPTTYVLDRAGRAVLRIEGSSPAELELLHDTVQALLAAPAEGPEA